MQNVHTRGNIRGNLPLFGQNAGFLPHLDKAGAHLLYFSQISGTKPGVRAEARFLHPDGAFIQNACLRPLYAAPQRAESPGRFSGTALLLFTDATKGSAFGANTKGRPLFLLAKRRKLS